MRRFRESGAHLLTSRYTIAELLEYGEMLDGMGYDNLKVGDHTLSSNPASPYPNSQVVLAAIGVRTRRAKLSTAVTDPYRRHPVEIAQWIATIDQMTSGRAVLGIGAGEEMNLTPFGIEWVKPFTRLKEAIKVVKLLWGATPSHPASFDGEVFRLSGAYLQTRPVQTPHPKLYVGALGKRTRELAGELADGWLPIATDSPRSLKEKLRDVTAGASRAGRDTGHFEVQASVYTDVSHDEEAAYRSVENTVKTGMVWERGILKQEAGLEIPEELSVQRMDVTNKDQMRRMSDFCAMIPRKIVEEVAVTGKPDDCITKIERLLDAGATSLIICNLGPDQKAVFEAYAKKIFPYLKEQYGGNLV